MLKTPISFKGPNGQLEQLFDENAVFAAYQAMKTEQITNWRFNEESNMVYAGYEQLDEKAQLNVYTMSLSWPIEATKWEQTAKCSCALKKPCKHLILLSVLSKSKLDILPPFTQQLRALRNVTETFVTWVNQQKHDPFPRMARHRLIYVIKQNTPQQLTLSLYKAYLTQENQFQVKANLDSGIVLKTKLPKFVSLADQQVLLAMHELGFKTTHTFTIEAHKHQKIMESVVKTGRCFWKACYRPPLKLEQINPQQLKNVKEEQWLLAAHLSLVPAQNTVFAWQTDVSSVCPLVLPEQVAIKPLLLIKTHWVELSWKAGFIERLDVAEIKFKADDVLFTLAEVTEGKIKLSQSSIEQVAAWCYQLEKLPSIHAQYDSPISEQFDINDRFIPNHFTTIAPLLLALERSGWEVKIDDSYRLNSQTAQHVYVKVDQQQGTEQNGCFDVVVGVQLAEGTINLLPYLVKAIKTGQFDAVKADLLIKLDDGRFVDMPKLKIMQIVDTFNELFGDKFMKSTDKITLNQHQLLRLMEVNEGSDSLKNCTSDGEELHWHGNVDIPEKIRHLATIKTLQAVPQPEGLQATLRPYQLTGLSWLQFLYEHELHGILADDMGLGKTLQVLAHFLTLKKSQQLNSPVLVVAPTSLLGNWQAECLKFTPSLRALVLAGTARHAHYKNIKQFDLVVTSYGVMSRDQGKMTSIDWHTVVLDEAQAIKNRKTQVAKIAKKLKTRHRLCLSGTPMENHLGELWSLFDFLMPGFLASEKMFQQLYQWPIEKENNSNKLTSLQLRLAPFILRRTKAEVARELPKKNEIIKIIELTEQQANVYESIRITMTDEIRKAVRNQQANQILISNALLRLRQVCCHPALLKLDTVKAPESAKLDWLSMAVPNLVEEGRKILIFSSFTSMLQIIADKMDELGIEYFKLTGATQPHKRTEQIDAFQAGNAPVFLISLKAGGAGINLTAADTVIHFDPWWNPAAEQQASDRAHRIGQDKQVFVYKLITHGTVEEKIHKLQLQKQQLADNLLSKSNDIAEILSEHQWERMLAPLKNPDKSTAQG